jgi:hypothetical protein
MGKRGARDVHREQRHELLFNSCHPSTPLRMTTILSLNSSLMKQFQDVY